MRCDAELAVACVLQCTTSGHPNSDLHATTIHDLDNITKIETGAKSSAEMQRYVHAICDEIPASDAPWLDRIGREPVYAASRRDVDRQVLAADRR